MGRRLTPVLDSLQHTYAGPGGAVAVVKEGEVLVRHTWGWANAEQRVPFTPRSLFRVCSITKQFTCGLLLELFPDLSVLDDDVRARLPRLEEPPPTMQQLCHNQSGLRDYWAVAMLHGSAVEAPFADPEAARVIGGSRTLQFKPGTRYSYSNPNFRIMSDILQDRTGRDFGELLRETLLERVGMEQARVIPDTRDLPDGTRGYEGTLHTGFRAAVNRIHWTGDAGLVASLDDMIAWERYIDLTRHDENGLYRRLSVPTSFADGRPAAYGFGLIRRTEHGRQLTGHTGMLRGWRSHRLHVPSERLSVVVLFNHMGDAPAAALDVLAAALEVDKSSPSASYPRPSWLGTYVEPETGLVTRIDAPEGEQLRLRYGHITERLELASDGSARNPGTRLQMGRDGLWMHRGYENQTSRLQPRLGTPTQDITGDYYCSELDAKLSIVDAGGTMYGAFSGFLGVGMMELLQPAAADLWLLPCRRALDAPPPGDWTINVQRNGTGAVIGIVVGCVLARRLMYSRIN